MGTACITAGIITFIMSTFARTISKNNEIASFSKLKQWFGLPSQENRDSAFGFLGQILGILWFVSGVVLLKADRLLSLSLLGILSKPVIAFLPLIIIGLIIRLLFVKSKK